MGLGEMELTDEAKQQEIERIRTEQRLSLTTWVHYLLQNDAQYPMWFRYYALRSVPGLSTFDLGTGKFPRRHKTTAKSFPELNAEALSEVYEDLSKKMQEGVLPEDEERQKLVIHGGFAGLYADSIRRLQESVKKEHASTTEGRWVKYDQGTSGSTLADTLTGYNTGWCVAGAPTAEGYLEKGDFYVYYSNDQTGTPAIPRAAIAVSENLSVTEVRGVLPGQNLEPEMTEIVQHQLDTLPEGDKYFHKVSDMRRVTALEQQMTHGQSLPPEDLRFLYELDREIEGFGWENDPRIETLQEHCLDHSGTLQLLHAASSDPDEKVRGSIVLIMAKRPDLFVEPLTKLAEEDQKWTHIVITAMAKCPELFIAPLAKLAADRDYLIREQVALAMAKRPDLFVTHLTQLEEDVDPGVRSRAVNAMMRRPELFVEPLTKLAEEDQKWTHLVIIAMKKRPDLFVDTLTKLAEGEDPYIQAVVSHIIRDHPDLFPNPVR